MGPSLPHGRAGRGSERVDDLFEDREQGWALMPDARDDEVTWSYDAVDDPWSAAFTPGVRPTRVVVGGETVFDHGQATRVDAVEVRARAAEAAQRLFARL